jgi:AraC-like DNA-binding protein
MANEKEILLSEHDKQCLALARKLLLEDLSVKHTINKLAQSSGINRYKLTYGFKQLYGKTIHGFAEEARMNNAKNLLADPDKTLKEIAAVNGYKRVENFITAFKKYYGITPNQFRKKGRASV